MATPGVDTIYEAGNPTFGGISLYFEQIDNTTWIIIGGGALLLAFMLIAVLWLSRPVKQSTKAKKPMTPKEQFVTKIGRMDLNSPDFAEKSWEEFLFLLEKLRYLTNSGGLTVRDVEKLLGNQMPEGFGEYVSYLKYARKTESPSESNAVLKKLLLVSVNKL